MKLLVGSIFTTCQHREWLNIQLNYLNATTYAYGYVCLLTQQDPDPYFASRVKCLSLPPHREIDQHEHCVALNYLTDYFKQQVGLGYSHFLYLDMDAFPIRRWQKRLVEVMGHDREIACLLRCENLEQRYHASVLFARPDALEHLHFEVGNSGDDLLGNPEIDVHMPEYQGERRKKVFPLLRSNMYMTHPILYGEYYGMFYHHGCGSGRNFNMRARNYWSHWSDATSVESFRQQLRVLAIPNHIHGPAFNPYTGEYEQTDFADELEPTESTV